MCELVWCCAAAAGLPASVETALKHFSLRRGTSAGGSALARTSTRMLINASCKGQSRWNLVKRSLALPSTAPSRQLKRGNSSGGALRRGSSALQKAAAPTGQLQELLGRSKSSMPTDPLLRPRSVQFQ